MRHQAVNVLRSAISALYPRFISPHKMDKKKSTEYNRFFSLRIPSCKNKFSNKNIGITMLYNWLCVSCDSSTASTFHQQRRYSALNAENWANEFNHLIKGNAINSQLCFVR